MITTLKNLAIYVQEGSRRRLVRDDLLQRPPAPIQRTRLAFRIPVGFDRAGDLSGDGGIGNGHGVQPCPLIGRPRACPPL